MAGTEMSSPSASTGRCPSASTPPCEVPELAQRNEIPSCEVAANEASAVGSVRTVNTGEVNYAASCPAVGYSASLAELNSGAACAGGKGIIDPVLGGGAKAGYTFGYATVAGADGLNDTYTVTGVPATIGTTGQRGFYSDQTGVIRYTLTGAAPTVASPAL
jgi:type IV pilus assembly protein PilA